MVDPDQALLERIRTRLAHWQPRLGLEAWHIEVEIADKNYLDDLSLGGFLPVPDEGTGPAVLYVRQDTAAAEVDWVVVHELLLLRMEPFQEWALAAPRAVIDRCGRASPPCPEAAAAYAQADGIFTWHKQLAQQLTKALMGLEAPPRVAAWFYDRTFMYEDDAEELQEYQSRGVAPPCRPTGPEPFPGTSWESIRGSAL